MKKQKTISRWVTTAAMAVVTTATSFAQTDLGAACGCPPVGSRTVVDMATLSSDITTSVNKNARVLTAANTILTCNNIYIMSSKIYVDTLKTLTIEPGTLIKAEKDYVLSSGSDSATMLIVQRGATLNAIGTPECPIVFTGINDAMDGSYSLCNRGDWGGIGVMGRAYNNLVAGQARYITTGVGYVEGFSSANTRIYHGNVGGTTAFNSESSGIIRYVSIRHSGSLISPGNEIQGLTLASVGNGTSIDHIDIISSDDDGIEIFGGTVNFKYVTAMFGNDDMIDWDNGWTGKAQFIFGVQADSTIAFSGDNGFEADGDDGSASPNKSNPLVYNVTLIGNRTVNMAADNTGHAAIEFKDRTDGTVANSVFANWGRGLNLEQTGAGSVYERWATSGTLKALCNTFINTKRGSNGAGAFGVSPMTITDVPTAVTASDTSKLWTDNNRHPASVAGLDYVWSVGNCVGNVIADKYDPIPTTDLATTCATPSGFFTPANYRGAFKAGVPNWMSTWSYTALVKTSTGMVTCPTDITGDGITNNVDFLQLLGKFGQSCQ